MNTHPLAELFPLITGDRFEDLCLDIIEHGQLNPIVVHQDLLIDGRNRLRACEHLGVEPRTIEFSELKLSCSPEEYIWAQNMARRHLSDDQRAAISMQWSEKLKTEAKERQAQNLQKGQQIPVGVKTPQRENDGGKSREKLAVLAQVTEHKIRMAQRVASSPELLARVGRGETKLLDAVREIEPPSEKTPIVKAVSTKQVAAAADIPTLNRKNVWNCQTAKIFKREVLRVVRAYEKSNAPIQNLVIVRRDMSPVDIEIVAVDKGEAWAS